jgi:trimethylamine--corrinoid protein Co-methyltransferase
MAVELIEAVGPVPGTFLNREHTRLNWRREYFIPRVSDRSSYQEWIGKGKQSMIDRAKERMEELLSTHKPRPVSAREDEDIQRILEDAQRYYSKRGLL